MGTSDITLYAVWEVIPHEHETSEDADYIKFDKVLNSSFSGGAISTSGNYYLVDDITLSQPITIDSGVTVNLCLNDKVLNLGGYNISNSGTLAIYDCGTTKRYFTIDSNTKLWTIADGQTDNYVNGGVITGGCGVEKGILTRIYKVGGAIYNHESAELVINGGNIVGNNSSYYGGGILNYGNFTMNKGNVVGNYALYYGGGISNHGTFTMNKGNIIENYTEVSGAGIYNNGVFILNGGVISKNNSADSGGGVTTNDVGTFSMSGGSITNNTATSFGAGVECNGTTYLLGGEITDNTITNTSGTYGDYFCGAGVDSYSKNLTVGGTIKIENNKCNNKQDNIFIYDNNPISISDTTSLSNNANIGIKLASNIGTFASSSDSGLIQYFHADDTNYGVIARKDEKDPTIYNYNVEEFYTVTYDGNGSTSGIVPIDNNKYFLGNSVSLSDNTGSLTKTGYKFLGWNSNSGSSSAITSFVIDSSNSTSGKSTLYAIWQEKTDVLISETSQSGTYNGNGQSYEIKGTHKDIDDFDIKYYVDGSYSGTAPTNVGSYDVMITRDEDDTYKAYSKEITNGLVINKAQLSVSGTTVDGKYYDGTTSASGNIGSVSGIIANEDVIVNIDSAIFENKNAGNGKNVTVTYKISGSASGNYIVPTSDNTIADIEKKQLTISGTIVESTKVYDATNYAQVSASGSLSGIIGFEKVALDTVNATYEDVNAGTNKKITVKYTIKGDDSANYLAPVDNTNLTANITKAEVELVDVSTSGITYGQKLADSSISGTAEFDKDSISGTWSWKEPETKPAVSDSDTTEYVAIFTPNETSYPNFKVIEINVKLKVNKAKIDVPEALTDLVYNGSSQTGVIALTGAKYGITSNSGKDAGDYTTTASLIDKNNYEWNLTTPTSDDQNIDWSIATKEVTVIANDITMNLGDTVPEFTASESGIVNGDKLTYTFNSLNPTAQGVYTIIPSGSGKQGNYTVSYSQGTLTVTKQDSDAKVKSSDISEVLETYQSKSGYNNKALDIEVRTDGNVLQTDKDLINQEVTSGKKIVFNDTELYLIIKDGTNRSEKNIGDENDNLISITYKFNFVNKKDIQVLRVHNNVVDELSETANSNGEYVTFDRNNGTITITAKKYSTYAFVYNEVISDNSSGYKIVYTGVDETNNSSLKLISLMSLVTAAGIITIKKRKDS